MHDLERIPDFILTITENCFPFHGGGGLHKLAETEFLKHHNLGMHPSPPTLNGILFCPAGMVHEKAAT